MPADALKPALRAALRENEVGDDTPYKLCYAKKAESGASFGFMQGDLNGNQPAVKTTFHAALVAAGFSAGKITEIENALHGHLTESPLSENDARAVDDALLASKALVDTMDEGILVNVYRGLDACTARADAAGRTIAAGGLIPMALWINMSGPPDKLLIWLDGNDPQLMAPVDPPGNIVDQAATMSYMKATKYFTQNPKNLKHFGESIDAGLALVPVG